MLGGLSRLFTEKQGWLNGTNPCFAAVYILAPDDCGSDTVSKVLDYHGVYIIGSFPEKGGHILGVSENFFPMLYAVKPSAAGTQRFCHFFQIGI